MFNKQLTNSRKDSWPSEAAGLRLLLHLLQDALLGLSGGDLGIHLPEKVAMVAMVAIPWDPLGSPGRKTQGTVQDGGTSWRNGWNIMDGTGRKL